MAKTSRRVIKSSSLDQSMNHTQTKNDLLPVGQTRPNASQSQRYCETCFWSVLVLGLCLIAALWFCVLAVFLLLVVFCFLSHLAPCHAYVQCKWTRADFFCAFSVSEISECCFWLVRRRRKNTVSGGRVRAHESKMRMVKMQFCTKRVNSGWAITDTFHSLHLSVFFKKPTSCFGFLAWLHVLLKFAWCMTLLYDYGHSVFNTFVWLTEGRSARDLPKQLPAKKKSCFVWFWFFFRIW